MSGLGRDLEALARDAAEAVEATDDGLAQALVSAGTVASSRLDALRAPLRSAVAGKVAAAAEKAKELAQARTCPGRCGLTLEFPLSPARPAPNTISALRPRAGEAEGREPHGDAGGARGHGRRIRGGDGGGWNREPPATLRHHGGPRG